MWNKWTILSNEQILLESNLCEMKWTILSNKQILLESNLCEIKWTILLKKNQNKNFLNNVNNFVL